MPIFKSKRTGKNIEIKEIPMATMMLLPPRADVCQECAVDHDPRLPHNQQSLYYQMKFKMEHGRDATWNDAMAHCTDDVKERWIEGLKIHGVEVV
jgi:hypothetical protein